MAGLTDLQQQIGGLGTLFDSNREASQILTQNNPYLAAAGGQNPFVQGTSMPRQIDLDRRKPYDWNFGQQDPHIQQPIQNPHIQNPYGGLLGLGGLSNIMNIPGQMTGFGEQLGGYGETLGGFGEQMPGFGAQMTGSQDALGGFNEQIGGFGKQFETVNNKLDSMEKGIAGLDQQLQTQQQPQLVQQQQQYQNPFSSPFGFSGFGGLGSLFGRRY